MNEWMNEWMVDALAPMKDRQKSNMPLISFAYCCLKKFFKNNFFVEKMVDVLAWSRYRAPMKDSQKSSIPLISFAYCHYENKNLKKKMFC